MCDKLHSVSENKTQTSKHLLQKQWYCLQKDAADDISMHVAKINDLVCRLRMLGEPVTDSMIITKILMTLPSSYQQFARAWGSTN